MAKATFATGGLHSESGNIIILFSKLHLHSKAVPATAPAEEMLSITIGGTSTPHTPRRAAQLVDLLNGAGFMCSMRGC